MAESSLMLEGEEISFFGDRSFNGGEKTKTQKDLTKNSSNPEKIYERQKTLFENNIFQPEFRNKKSHRTKYVSLNYAIKFYRTTRFIFIK